MQRNHDPEPSWLWTAELVQATQLGGRPTGMHMHWQGVQEGRLHLLQAARDQVVKVLGETPLGVGLRVKRWRWILQARMRSFRFLPGRSQRLALTRPVMAVGTKPVHGGLPMGTVYAVATQMCAARDQSQMLQLPVVSKIEQCKYVPQV